VPAVFRDGRLPVKESCSLCSKRADFFASLNHFDYRVEDTFCTECLDRQIEQSGPIIEYIIPLGGEDSPGTVVTPDEFMRLLRGEPVIHGFNRRVLTFDDGPFRVVERGGPGSGHHGHEGRPGEVGGSRPSGAGGEVAEDYEGLASDIPPEIRSRRYFHATSHTSRGKSILESGMVRPGEAGRIGPLAPVEGRVYVTQDPEYALVYSLGGDMAGSNLPEHWIEDAGQYGYIFEIDPQAFTDIQPDEDVIGEHIHKETFPWLNRLARQHLSSRMLADAQFGEYDAWAEAGKKLVGYMTPEQKYEIILSGSHVSALGELPIIAAWRVDKTQASQYERYTYAEEDTEEDRRRRIDLIWQLSQPVERSLIGRHFGPGAHSGTGTDQDVHAGDGEGGISKADATGIWGLGLDNRSLHTVAFKPADSGDDVQHYREVSITHHPSRKQPYRAVMAFGHTARFVDGRHWFDTLAEAKQAGDAYVGDWSGRPVERHYGPGPHPGTGTGQEIHAGESEGSYGPPIPDVATDEQVAGYNPVDINNFRIVGVTDLSDAKGRLIGPGEYADAVSRVMQDFYRRTGFKMSRHVISNEWIALAEAGGGTFAGMVLPSEQLADKLQDTYEDQLYGAYIQAENTLFISPNTRLMRPDQQRFSFVIAHELGHWLHHRVDLSGLEPSEEYFGAMSDTYGMGRSLEEEYIADLIAAHVLDGEVYRFHREQMNRPLTDFERSDAEEVISILKKAPVLRSRTMTKRAEDRVLVYFPQTGEVLDVPRDRLSELPETAEIFGDRLRGAMSERAMGFGISDPFMSTDPNMPLDPGGLGVEFHEPVQFDPKTADPAYIYASLSMSPPLLDLQKYVLDYLDSAGAAYDAQEPERFHITLLYIEKIDNWQLQDLISHIQFPAAFTVEGVRLGTFKEADDKPLVLMIDPDNALLRIQRELYERAVQMGLKVSEYSRPGHYKPHVTLAYDMEPADQRMPKLDKPIQITVDSVAITRPDYRLARVVRLPTVPGGAAFVIRRFEPDMFDRMRQQRDSVISRAFSDMRRYLTDLVGSITGRQADNEEEVARRPIGELRLPNLPPVQAGDYVSLAYLPLTMAWPHFGEGAFDEMRKIADATKRHYGPSAHPGTGTEQEVHAGEDYASEDDISEWKAEQKQLVEYAQENWRVVDSVHQAGRGYKIVSLWLDPDGVLYDPGMTHWESAIDAYEGAGLWDADRARDARQRLELHGQKELVEMGFVRVSARGDRSWLVFQMMEPSELTRDQREVLAVESQLVFDRRGEVFAEPSSRALGLPDRYESEEVKDMLGLRSIIKRHYGPGPHPGTGTDQDIHAGVGAALSDPVEALSEALVEDAMQVRRAEDVTAGDIGRGWLLPDGRFADSKGSHDNSAGEALNAVGVERINHPYFRFPHAESTLIKMGFIRMGFSSSVAWFGTMTDFTPDQAEFVARLLDLRPFKQVSVDWYSQEDASLLEAVGDERLARAQLEREIARAYRTINRTWVPAIYRGGPGSGHFEHEGRLGEIGGSLPADGVGGAQASDAVEGAGTKQAHTGAIASDAAAAAAGQPLSEIEPLGERPFDLVLQSVGVAADAEPDRYWTEMLEHQTAIEMQLTQLEGEDRRAAISVSQQLHKKLTMDSLALVERDELWRQPRDEFVDAGRPELISGATPEGSAILELVGARRQAWQLAVNRAIQRGDLEIDEDGNIPDLGYYNSGGGKWVPLEGDLYHVTTAISAVRETGLRSRFELAMQRGVGLGGGDDQTISFTQDPGVARGIERGLHEARLVARDDITSDDLMTMAAEGTGAERPFIDDLMLFYSSDWKEGDWAAGRELPQGLRSVLEGTEYGRSAMGQTLEDWQTTKGDEWEVAEAGRSWEGGDGRTYHTQFVRPATEEEQLHGRFELYKRFSAYREYAGGYLDPLFFSSDPAALAEIDPAEIATVRYSPQSNSRGSRQGALGEIRTYGTDGLQLSGEESYFDIENGQIVERHYGPGTHPGTGTEQEAHAGDGGGAATDVAERPSGATGSEKQSGVGGGIGDFLRKSDENGGRTHSATHVETANALELFGRAAEQLGAAVDNRASADAGEMGGLPREIAEHIDNLLNEGRFSVIENTDMVRDILTGLEVYEFEMDRHKLAPSMTELIELQTLRGMLGSYTAPGFDPDKEGLSDLSVEMGEYVLSRGLQITDDPGKLALYEQPWFQRQVTQIADSFGLEDTRIMAPWATGLEGDHVVPDIMNSIASNSDLRNSNDFHPEAKTYYFDVFRHLANMPGTPEAAYMIDRSGSDWRFQIDSEIMAMGPGQWLPPDESKFGEGAEIVADYVNTAWTESARHPASVALMEEVSRQYGGTPAPESDPDGDFVSEWGEEFSEEPRNMPGNSSEILSGYVTRTYDATQQWLAERDYRPGDTVRLFRGLRTLTGEWNPSGEGGDTTVDMWSVSSWTSDLDTARSFAEHEPFSYDDDVEDLPGAIVAADIPIERLFANSDTGMPSKGEYEWLVLGKDGVEGTVYSTEDSLNDAIMWGAAWNADLTEVAQRQNDHKRWSWDEHQRRAENTAAVKRAGGARSMHIDELAGDWLKVLAYELARAAEANEMNASSPIEVKGMLRRVVRHYGPGTHPGTGTEQDIHAGGGRGRGRASSARAVRMAQEPVRNYTFAENDEYINHAQQVYDRQPPEIKAQIDEVRQRIKEGQTTQSIYKDPETGEYSPDRQTLHEQIIEQMLAGRTPEEQPSVLMTGGYPGSGKGTIFRHLQQQGETLENYVWIDSDAIKEQLPEYEGWNAALTHQEASDIVEEIVNRAASQRLSIVYDATMRNQSESDAILRLFEDQGYSSRIVFVDVPIDVAMDRAITRFAGGTGRFVDLNYIATHDGKNVASLEALKETVDQWEHWDNNVPFGQEPILIGSGQKEEE
jgi:2'-5' RNA ligase/predicted ABC-type ATPase